MNDDGYQRALFTALAHPTRWKMLQLLEQKSVRSIAELGRTFELSHVAITKHVIALEKGGLITRMKIGKYHRIEINQDLWNKVLEL
ncbi:MAG TPA: helix-turn-helix transcriptional regulator [Candidatus Andersenbacteria bacterium]|nr:helix-turn-helix transcriptional regulator [Candidatus Andersenbacteria bacterium]